MTIAVGSNAKAARHEGTTMFQLPWCLRACVPSSAWAKRRLARGDRCGERDGPIARARDRHQADVGAELRAAIDRRHREIELGTAAFAGQRDPDRMEERFPLLPRLLLDAVRGRPE